MKELSIFIITHKNYDFPNSSTYQPLFVGDRGEEKSQRFLNDHTGTNIAEKNSSFCELTGLYWLWKNHIFTQYKYIGLVHYRRYFKGKGEYLKNKSIASENELLFLLKKYHCIVPKKRHYLIENVYSHYKNAHFIQDLDCVRLIISKKHPSYLPSFDKVMNSRSLYLYNMFVMRSNLINNYCEWLFDILFEVEEMIDINSYDNYQKRVFGFLSERLFNVWLLHNELKVKQVDVINLEGENLLKKGINLLRRKFRNK